MLQCERLFGEKRAAQIRIASERATGKACPCMRALPCPLAPRAPVQEFLVGVERAIQALPPRAS